MDLIINREDNSSVDIFSSHLFQILLYVDDSISTMFFPSPGPSVSHHARIKAMKAYLSEISPLVNVEQFILEYNSYRKRSTRPIGIKSRVIIYGIIAIIPFIIFKIIRV